MPELPSGTVTLLFSDVEGSTALVRELGEAWGAVLQRQRELCRQAWGAHEGHELGTEGDSFMVVFATAGAGVAAAAEAQRLIAAESWPQAIRVGVRIGIHTGSPMRGEEGYVGLDVHKAARVAAAAHGGQVLVSEATATLVDGTLAADEALLDLGEHALKDIPHRIRLYQLIAPGLAHKFLPLKTQGGAGSLPPLLTPTVGRDSELAELRALLVDKQVRLVTLTGLGGTGKTRLAISLATQLADEYADGVFFVPLDSATTGEEIWAGIARVLDVPADGQVPPGFFAYVAQRSVLLVLDNLEQIEDADKVCRDLLAVAPHVSIVATCRRPLHVEGEYDHALAPLLLPHDTQSNFDEIASSGAVQMFVDHAKRAKRTFELTPENAVDIAQLCSALDGLPLALELVAARVRLLSPRALLTRIDQALDLATSDRSRADRQRTVRGAIEWSYRLLDAPQRTVLDHLGAFEGGADLEAVEAVLPPGTLEDHDHVDVLFELLDASLIRVQETDDGEPRFILLETVKRFAHDQLARQGTLEAALVRHAQHFYDRAKQLYQDAVLMSAYFLDNLDNYAAVVERGAQGIRDPEWYESGVPPLHAIALLSRQASSAGKVHVAISWCRSALAQADTGDDPAGTFAVQVALAEELGDSGRPELALGVVAEAEPRAGLVDHARPLPEWADPTDQLADLLCTTAWAHTELDDIDAAGLAIAELQELDPQSVRARRNRHMAQYYYLHRNGRFDEARPHLEQQAALNADPVTVANNLADLDLQLGNRQAGQRRLAQTAAAACAQADPRTILIFAATFGATIGQAHPLLCARVYGSYERARVIEALPDSPAGVEEDERVLSEIRPLVSPEEWAAAWAQGATENLPDLILEMAALPPLSED